jgi:hypothetical protein
MELLHNRRWIVLCIFIICIALIEHVEATGSQDRLAAIRAEYDELDTYFHADSTWEDVSTEEISEAFRRVWSLVGEWTIGCLDEHPEATEEVITACIEELDYVNAHTLQLVRGASPLYVVSADFSVDGFPVNGTFFVVTRTSSGQFQVAWNMKDLAHEHYAERDEIGYWAYVTFPQLLYGDGALIGTVSALPPSRAGHPRFYVEAVASAHGGTQARQISVWQWNGREAQPLLIHSYHTIGDSGEIVFDGESLKIPTKESFQVMFSCGSCPTPRAIWTLKITPDGVEDRGRVYDDPELQQLDILWAHLLNDEPAQEIASPHVIDTLHQLIDEDGYTSKESVPLSMLGRWSVTRTPSHHRLCFSTDNLSRYLVFEGEKRQDRVYFSTVRLFEDWNAWVTYCEHENKK